MRVWRFPETYIYRQYPASATAGSLTIDDKPAPIDLRSADQKIRQSAAQMITLPRELPMLVADLIPEADEHWKSFLLLLKISSIAFSRITTPDTIAYLRILIEEKLTVFKALYPDPNSTT